MFKYIVKRLIISALTLLVLCAVVFFAIKFIPGDPFSSPEYTEEIRQQLQQLYGLDKPVMEQFGVYMSNLLQGDLGISIYYRGKPVVDIIKSAFPKSLDLGLRALLLASVVGVGLGILAALNRKKPLDYVSIIIAIIGISIPSFVVASLLQYTLTIKFPIFPVARYTTFRHTILPTIALALPTIARFSRLMRTSMLEVIDSDFVKTARSKGLKRHQILFSHQVRNSLLPLMAILGPTTAQLLTGSFVVESIFAVPGLGSYFVESINTHDYSLIMGLTIFYGLFLVTMNFIVDILYGVVDPRIRLGGTSNG
ncbi:MAG: ABC transporter permease [Angelakisella sp.]|nr:ABC transporter permease [Angelakisella sp.]